MITTLFTISKVDNNLHVIIVIVFLVLSVYLKNDEVQIKTQ